MRPPSLRLHTEELIVDSFAGGGGASLGIEIALGRSPDIAVNHDAEAIAMHAANHPDTRHYCESVWAVDPRMVTAGRPVALAWFSPDCKHFSKAKGGKPVEKKIRGLAWVVIRWAKAVKPRIIILENVEEFQGWGPLLADGTPCPARKGMIFHLWLNQLRDAGYHVEYRELRACDYGAPTTRKRLFVIARCDGQPIVWPSPTRGPLLAMPYRTAAECIDWSLPCPSIFERARPLANNTLRRIARGLRRYVIDAADPFVIPLTHQGDSRTHSIREPFRTITGAHRGENALVAPTLVRSDMHKSNAGCAYSPGDPLRTITTGGGHALVSAFLAKHYGGHEATGSRLTDPMDTVTSVDHHALVTSHMLKLRGGLDDHHTTAQDWRAPAPTITASGYHLAEVRAFLIKYYGCERQDPQLGLPLGTVTTRDRFGLVTVHGQEYAIADIGMRMLAPRELFRAQGFPDTYNIDALMDGKPLSKTAQVKMCGNSVCPPLAAALVAANVAQVPNVAAG